MKYSLSGLMGSDFDKTSFSNRLTRRLHSWVTVVDPTNHRTLLQACDDCGVVKSENSIIRNCKAPNGRSMISSAMSASAAV